MFHAQGLSLVAREGGKDAYEWTNTRGSDIYIYIYSELLSIATSNG